MSLKPGQVVRLQHDPAMVGTLTTSTKMLGGRMHWQVHFSTGFQYVPEDQLEPADAAKDPLDLLASATLSPARDLRRVLTHARLSGKLADVIYSLETTRTDFYPHQFKPVLKLLTSVSDGILIADEVGLGKTIEAGLIWTELRTRFEYRRLFVLCPAVLREKWRMELRNRFGVLADPCDAAQAFERLRQAGLDSIGESFALIGSMQGLRPRGDWTTASGTLSGNHKLARLLEERGGDTPLIDLLVIDEAHHMRNTDTATASLGRLLRGVASHVVMLSATPVNLGSDDLFSLMRLLDEDTFVSKGEFDDILRANGPLVAAREKILRKGVGRAEFLALLEEARRHPILRESQSLAWMIQNPPTDEELESHRMRAELAYQLDQVNLLGQVINRTRKREVQEHQIQRKAVPEAVTLSTIEADFYHRVTEVVRDFCRKSNASEGFLLTMPQRQMASSIPAAFRYWRERLESQAITESQNLEDEDDGDVEQEFAPRAQTESGALVRELLERVRELGDFKTLRVGDSKYARLLEALRVYIANDPDAKIVLFTSFRATLRYLDERLREDGLKTLMMHGDTKSKDDVIESFRQQPGAVVLLSSEVGSEGVDLQFSRIVVNYDMPWNPMRVEQRIGRLDRLGQRARTVTIWNLFCAETIDERIYQRLYLRIGIFERALGGLEPILGREIQELTRQLMSDELSPNQEIERIDATALAIENRRKIEEDLEDNAAQLFALGDYLLEQVKAARELGRRIFDQDLLNYVVEFLRLHHPDTKMEHVGGDPLMLALRLSSEAKVKLESFIKKHRIASSTRLTFYSGAAVPCRFRNTAVDVDGKGTETINQFHPLVRYARDTLRETESDLKLAIATEVRSDRLTGHVPPGRYVFAVERWSVSGVQEIERLAYEATSLADGQRLEEDEAERLVHAGASEGLDWLSAASDVDVERAAGIAGDACLTALSARYEKYERTVRLQNQDRADALLKTLERQMAGQTFRLEQTIVKLQSRGKTSLVAATRGRIERLLERTEMRRLRIQEGAKITTSRTLFLTGLIQVRP